MISSTNSMNDSPYGMSRVLEPKYVLPTSAWRLDNSRDVRSDEIRVSVDCIHMEGTSFKQICQETNNNEEKIKRQIIDMVIRRGKLHNPVTNTGGLMTGKVDAIGTDYKNKYGLEVGDPIICNASLASIPLYLSEIKTIDFLYNQIEVEGYALIHSDIPLVPLTDDIDSSLMMTLLDESGTLFRLNGLIKTQERFLIVGNNMMTNLIYGYVIRRKVGPLADITCLLDKKTAISMGGGSVDMLVSTVFNQIHFVDILKPMECLEMLNMQENFDLSVNCAEIPGAETINILATRPGGTVLFANLINNLQMALYITESVSKDLVVRNAAGYLEGYDEFDIEVAKEISDYFRGVQIVLTDKNVYDEPDDNPYGKSIVESSLSEDFVYKSKPMRDVLSEIMKVSKYDCNVIIFGDTGVGKEKVANIIQKNSERKMQPFIKINCGAISPNLIESEFFGYERGAFTGANANGKKGYFEIANNGVMFLDEVGELPLDMQAKLLRVIQDGEFYRVGGTQPVKTNVRIISATNRNLEEMVEEGTFRRDLYYRLNVVPIRIPKLCNRPEDIKPLIKNFLKIYSGKFGIACSIDDSAIEYLEQCQWPGNIRELENTIQRLIISSNGNITLVNVIGEMEGGFENGEQEPKKTDIRLDSAVSEFEANLIKRALAEYGSTRKAAAAMGISQSQLMRKKQKYGL